MAIDTYATLADLQAALGNPDTSGVDDRLTTALVVASGWVGSRVGVEQTYPDLTPPYTLALVACPAAWRAATIIVAIRVYKSADIPFGVLSTGEYATQVRARIPEAELALVGQRTNWGIG